MTTLRSATTTPAPFPWPTLFLVRPGATPPGDYLGWVVSIPAPPTSRRIREGGGSTAPDGLSAAEALDRALEAVGFAGNFAGMGSPARIVAWGLVAPSSWERKVVDWVVARLGGQAEFLPNPAPPTALPAIADAARVLQDPLGLLGHRDPTRVAWIDGSDRDLEAHGVARFLRERLNRLPPDSWPRAWGDIRILLPDGRARRNAWESALTRAGIPVLDPPRQPLLDTGAARWLLRLLDLADWSRGPKERSLLQVVLDSPFLRFNGDARRADLRRALRGLRRHQVDLAGWVDHVEGYFANLDADAQRRDDDADGAEDRRKRCVALVDQSRKWAKALEGPEAKGYLNRVRDRVRQSWQGHTRPGHDSINLRATQQCLGLLDSLAHDREADAAVAGLSPQEALGRRLGSIRDGLAARTLGQDTTPRCGVHLATYLAWDGSPAAIQVLAGLEEGGYPAAPDRRSEDDEAWAKALGLPDPADELERQAAIAAAAAAVTRELLVVSSSRADEAGSETFPGPLLAAFEADNRTSRAPRVSPSPGGYRATQVGDAEVLAPAEVLMPADLTLAREARTSPEVSVALRDDLDRARHAAEHAAAVASARAPRAGVVPVGPYSGLVAADLSGRPMSATGLEALGQCGMKYFLGRVLGIEAESDSGVSLEPAEQGTLIHEAFADCVRETGTWDLRCPEDPGDRPAWLQAESQRLHEALKVESGKLARRNPSFSAGLLKALRHRWERTVDGWLSRLGKPGPVFDLQVAPNPERADPRLLTALVQGNDDARKALDNWQAKRDGLSPILAFLAATARTAHPTKKAAVEARKTVDKAGLIPAGKFDLIGNETDDVVRMRACDEIASEAPSIVEKARDKLAASLQKIIARDRKLLPLLAVAAETPIGTPESPCRIDLGDGLALGFRGRIDRVDRADPTRPAAVVDYKTGKAKGATALLKAVGAGLHLQLPLYAMALETVGLDGGPITVAQGALDHPRGGRAQLEVANDAPPALEPVSDDAGDGEQPRNEAADALTVRDAVRQHLRHAVGRLADGRLPLIPRSCPLHGSGNQACDFAVVCGHDPDVLGKVVEDDPQPSFAPLTKASRDPKDKTDLPFACSALAVVGSKE
jgi:RecB family exonuclease